MYVSDERAARQATLLPLSALRYQIRIDDNIRAVSFQIISFSPPRFLGIVTLSFQIYIL